MHIVGMAKALIASAVRCSSAFKSTNENPVPFVLFKQWRLEHKAGPGCLGQNLIPQKLPNFITDFSYWENRPRIFCRGNLGAMERRTVHRISLCSRPVDCLESSFHLKAFGESKQGGWGWAEVVARIRCLSV